MEENNQNFSQDPAPQNKDGSVGALVGSIIVIVVLVLGAIYIWGENFSPNDRSENLEDTEEMIEDDLENEDLDSLDAEFNQSLDTEI